MTTIQTDIFITLTSIIHCNISNNSTVTNTISLLPSKTFSHLLKKSLKPIIPYILPSTPPILISPQEKEEKYQSQSTRRSLCIDGGRRRSHDRPGSGDSRAHSAMASYQRDAHTCLHVCRSVDKRGQNVTVRAWSEVGSSSKSHRARSVSPHPSCRRVLDTEGARLSWM